MSSLIQIKQIVDLSDAMLNEAQNGRWQQVIDMQNEREVLIGQSFPVDEPCEEPEEMHLRVSSIVALDNQVMRLAKLQQKELGRSLGEISTGRQAAQAYIKASR